MEPTSGHEQSAEGGAPKPAPRRSAVVPGLQIQPFWVLVAGWSVLCGALASHSAPWHGEALLAFATAFLLVTVAWSGLWSMATGSDWASLLQGERDRAPVHLPSLPYTRPGSPAGRMGRRMIRLVGWWRETFWPTAGSSAVMIFLSVALAVLLSILLPSRVRWLNLALVAPMALGMIQRRRSRAPLAAQALLFVGLPWLAGYFPFSVFRWHALLLSLFFSLSVWGVVRVARGMVGGSWLLHGGQLSVAVMLVILRQPLAAGGIVLLAFGPLLSWLTQRLGGDPPAVARRTWPWLLAAMLVASLAFP